MKIKLTQWQKEVANDQHRFRVVCAGRRAGKSYLAQAIVMKWAVEMPGVYYIISPTYKQSKSIHWRDLNANVPLDWVKKKNEVELSITLHNGSVIELKGAEQPDNLRGVKLRGLVIDEIASIRNWEWLWKEVIRPTLTDYSAPGMFISTPKGFNHFYELFQRGQADDPLYKSWRFTSYDNEHIKKEEIDLAKLELSEDTFAQEFLADFRRFAGLAIPMFDRNIHVIDPFEVPNEWQRVRGFDYGSNDPTASLRIAVDQDGNMFAERAYKQRGAVIRDHATAVLAQDYGLGYMPIYGDPSGDQWEREFALHGLHINPASKETGQNAQGYVAFTIETINQKLKPIPGHTVRLPNGKVIDNAPSLFFLNTPEIQMLIKEIELLKWKETATGQTIPVLDEYIDPDGHSDLVACLRYLLVSYKKRDMNIVSNTITANYNRRKKWKIR